jgi:phosphopantothenoylcysteine decarboxylase/phosphopantothenate--cysteine ligase
VKIALGVTGCIGAYKAVEVMRTLQKAGVSVQTVMTRSATRFVRPLTFESLSGNPVITGMFARGLNREIEHIRLAQAVQLLAVVPATANILGKFANGIADDFLSTLYLSCPAPVLLAPAMNVEMWNHPAVRRNVDVLKARGNIFVDPVPGVLACGMEGEGKLAEVDAIAARILEVLGCSGALSGIRVLVTAGPTIEDIDPVRFLSNRSSGKMGYALAHAARMRGADVVLVSGPTSLAPPAGVELISVRSAAQMMESVLEYYPGMDMVIKAAAVGDYRPREYTPHKIKKEAAEKSIDLVPTEDILATLGRAKKGQILVGFSAETRDVLANAGEKLRRKNLDMIVANDVAAGVFGEDTATVEIIDATGRVTTIRNESKLAIANRILDLAQTLLADRRMPVSRESRD